MKDLLIHNGVLWSAGGILPGDAVAVSQGRITALGSRDEVRAAVGTDADVLDARGGMILPSFADAHAHPVIGGVEMSRCNLSGSLTADKASDRIRAYARSYEGSWIQGGGWEMPLFDGGLPTREQLDVLVPDRPALLFNADHHGAWANSRALELAGITAATPDPADGRIERDASGEPSGMLHEGASELVLRCVGPMPQGEVASGLAVGCAELNRQGVTAWQDALVGEFTGYPDSSDAYAAGLDSGAVRGHATGALWVPRDLRLDELDVFIEKLIHRREVNRAAGFVTSTAKIMLDGVAENQTAAMHDPYLTPCGCGVNRGISYFEPELVAALVLRLNSEGFAAHFHAIGDRAVSDALDAVARVPESVRQHVRNHIAHVQVVRPDDVARFAALGVTMNAQALWACNEEQMIELTVPVLGDERASWQYPFGSVHRAGAELAMGSDWPISSCDPWQAIHVAVNRSAPGSDAAPLLLSEAITLEVALSAYTRGSHRLLGIDGSGELYVGANADLVTTDRNPFAAPASEIHLTTTTATVLQGEILWRS